MLLFMFQRFSVQALSPSLDLIPPISTMTPPGMHHAALYIARCCGTMLLIYEVRPIPVGPHAVRGKCRICFSCAD